MYLRIHLREFNKKMYRIHWMYNETKVSGCGKELCPYNIAKSWVDLLNDKHKDQIYHWIVKE